jgi:GDP-6-deoxy-D-talose 4-dehydrogenase
VSRTLVTGAAGFTGRYLVSALAERGAEVLAIVHHGEDDPIVGAASTYPCDLTRPEAIAELVATLRPERAVHLAAIAFVAHGDVEELYRTNIVGTRNLLQALAAGASPEAVLIASSANIYGNAREGVLDETMPAAPANDYGVSKVATELVAGLYRDRLPLTIVRPFNYTGRGQSLDFLIPKIVDHVRRRAPEIELGNLDVARDFSDVRAVVDAYARLLETPAALGGTYNVCSGRAVPLGEVLEIVTRLSGHDMAVRVNPAFVRSNEVRSLRGTAERLEALIGPLAMPSLEETLRWMLEA